MSPPSARFRNPQNTQEARIVNFTNAKKKNGVFLLEEVIPEGAAYKNRESDVARKNLL